MLPNVVHSFQIVESREGVTEENADMIVLEITEKQRCQVMFLDRTSAHLHV